MRIKLVEVMLLGSSIENLSKGGSGSREKDYYESLRHKLDLHLFEYTNDGNKWIFSVLQPFKIFRQLNKNKFNLIRSKQFYGSWSGFIISKLTGSKHIIRCGYIWSKSFLLERKIKNKLIIKVIYYFEKFFMNLADGYIFCSDEILDAYMPIIRDRPYIVLPNYVDSKFFFPTNKSAAKDYVYIGRLIDLKGCKESGEYIISKAKEDSSLFIGNGDLLDIIESMNIKVLQRVENYNLRDILIEYKFFLSLSKTEGSPKALFEAIFCGLVPVLSNIKVHRDIINDLGYGILVDESGNEKKINNGEFNHKSFQNFVQKHDKLKHIKSEMEFFKNFVG